MNNYQSIIEWNIFNNYKHILTAGITTRISPGFSQKDKLINFQKNQYSSFNLGLHVGDIEKNVVDSRNKLCLAIDFPFEGYTCAEQIHENNVVKIDNDLKGKGRLRYKDSIPRCDALITNKPGILLNIFVADCVPVIIFDPVNLCCAVIHAGWRGVVKGIVEKTIKELHSSFGCNPSNLLVGLGPSIDNCCFDVNEDTAKQILEGRSYSPLVLQKRNGSFFINLKLCISEQLENLGVQNEFIEVSPFCTKCNSELFYSYRASQGNTGRFSGFIGIR